MSFSSFEFLVFFPIAVLIHYLLPHKLRWAFLLASSCLFYMAFIPKFIFILFFTIVIDYAAGIGISHTQGLKKKLLLVLSIFSTCMVLLVFKYFNFFVESAGSIAHFFHLNYPLKKIEILLPIGLSFHTFQSLSYVIEVYFGRQKPERHFGIYSLYVMFFPQLVAGPIERPQNLLFQFHKVKTLDPQLIAYGLKLMAWGFFKKLVIADRVSILVDHVYKEPGTFGAPMLVLATIFFSIQIYCDFSGYSDIARGAAKVLGYNLMVNFRQPYFAASVPEFWQRWHISLSTWFKDYVYIPMGGNRVSKARRFANLLTVFAISGIWHGANWTYVIWGLLNGIYSITGFLVSDFPKLLSSKIANNFLKKLLSIALTYLLICSSWIFFRSASVEQAIDILWRSINGWSLSAIRVAGSSLFKKEITGLNPTEVPIVCVTLLILIVVDIWKENVPSVNSALLHYPKIRWALYIGLVSSILLIGNFESGGAFIYFQF